MYFSIVYTIFAKCTHILITAGKKWSLKGNLAYAKLLQHGASIEPKLYGQYGVLPQLP